MLKIKQEANNCFVFFYVKELELLLESIHRQHFIFHDMYNNVEILLSF